jgi:hypothetical protein
MAAFADLDGARMAGGWRVDGCREEVTRDIKWFGILV